MQGIILGSIIGGIKGILGVETTAHIPLGCRVQSSEPHTQSLNPRPSYLQKVHRHHGEQTMAAAFHMKHWGRRKSGGSQKKCRGLYRVIYREYI